MDKARALFQQHYKVSPRALVQAPGRLELLGNHTDYNEGLVLSLAVDKYIFIAAGPRNDGKIELISSAFPEPEIFSMDRLEKNPKASWANYVKGVLDQLRRRRVHFTGFNAAIHGTIPLGAGMSSSAALEVAAALAIRQLFPFRLKEHSLGTPPARDVHGHVPPPDSDERMQLAKLCQAAESEFVGVNCGLLDQISSLFGKAGQVIEIDCQHHTVSYEPMLSGVQVVVCNSGVKHELAAGEYNAMRRHCESAARALGVRSLRLVTLEQLRENKAKLEARDFECALHVVGEIQRVVYGGRALRANDLDQFGVYLFQSHESSRVHFKNSCEELDVLVDLAREQAGCVGARLTGGGFGGATINLVRTEKVNDFVEAVSTGYRERTGRELEAWVCQVVVGAGCE